ncbi:MAG: DEAD/DEAH box helicase family protein [Clostridiales bacterium]|nr:DEAD/DEAH box helicase family protein [Clostridiales bacterium]
MLKPGLYEQVINTQLSHQLSEVPEARKSVAPIDKSEASKVLSQYLSDIVQKGLDNVLDNGGDIAAQIGLANQIVNLIQITTNEADFAALSVDERAEQLLALLHDNDPSLVLGRAARDLARPETSIAQSSLFTGAVHEPQMFSELKKEILSANQIDMLVSFIKWSGLRLIIDELREFTQNGGELRIITTSYMGATDIKAVEELSKLPHTEIKVSYDTKRTRLHAKTYVFYRDTGFTTAYVGSSNLSNAAMSSGLEWNVKVTAKDLPETVQKITATFDSYWNSTEFEFYKEDERERLFRALKAERYMGDGEKRRFVFDIHPYPYQQEILDKLNAEREVRHLYRNLVVAATGTGKTVISAFDYRRFSKARPGGPNRLLFVAHREEILKQSRDTFQGVLKDPNFGELFVGGYRPESIDHLFISIQTMNSQALYEKLPQDFYDYIVVDEFHHAAAPTYQKMLDYFKPQILLGLTATPERMDGKSIMDFFEGRIAAEIRLPEAIDRKLLCPFQYFGVTDTTDLSELRWVRGGYDKTELSNLYSLNRAVAERRAGHIVQSLDKYVTDIDEVKGLGFCVSVEHAKFMAEFFNDAGIPSICLVGNSSDEERVNADMFLQIWGCGRKPGLKKETGGSPCIRTQIVKKQ